MNNIKEFTDMISRFGNTIATVIYEGSEKPLKNVCLGAKKVRTPSYGEAINNVLFRHKGKLYLRVVDNNDKRKPKNLLVSKVESIHARKMSWVHG